MTWPLQRSVFCQALLMIWGVTAGQAYACAVSRPFDSAAAKLADVVVVGRIANYDIIPKAQTGVSDPAGGQKKFSGNYARFDILVDDVLAGKAPGKLSVTWDSHSSGEPERMTSGLFLIALRKPASPQRNAIIMPGPDRNALTVMDWPCSEPFIYPINSPEAAEVRRVLSGLPPNPNTVSVTAQWALQPSDATTKSLYPPRALADELEGWVTIECIAAKTGRVERCKVHSESPKNYGFADATIRWTQSGARLKPGAYKPGNRVRITRKWQLD